MITDNYTRATRTARRYANLARGALGVAIVYWGGRAVAKGMGMLAPEDGLGLIDSETLTAWGRLYGVHRDTDNELRMRILEVIRDAKGGRRAEA